MHLVQSFVYVVGIALLLNLNDGQTVDKQRRVESSVLLPRYFCRALNLVNYLVNRIAGANLTLIKHGEKHMATVIEIDLDL